MELFVKVYFYVTIVSIVLTLIALMLGKYPRETKHTVGSDVAKLFLSTGLLIWVTVLLYFNN